MTLRHLAAAALACGALVSIPAPASATCYVGNIDICDKPTDPYTDPVVREVQDTIHDPVFDPAWGVVGTASQAVADAYADALCLVGDYPYCD